MPDTVIKVEDLSKLYRLGEVGTGSLAHDINRWWHCVRGKEDPYTQVGQVNDRTKKAESDWVWALKDINFEVKQGEVLGIIGRNGAGKSTLLKILSRVTAPTRGSVKVKGRIASLLEVGTGFHPDLTGRENIYLNGAILGMRKKEIDGKLDEIVDFSGCEAYLDTPVKRYSSGMQVRLAFAVAAHLEPEILIVDEVLAVGDVEFQKKCLGKMESVAKGGRTVLFVSHNLTALRTLCTEALLLAQGKLECQGAVNPIADFYLSADDKSSASRSWDNAGTAPGDDLMRLRKVQVRSDGATDGIIEMDRDVGIEIEYDVLSPHDNVSVSIHVLTQGVCAFVGGTIGQPHSRASYRVVGRIPGGLLNNNLYSISVFLITNATQFRVFEKEIVSFQVEEFVRKGDYIGHITGTVRPRMTWDVMRMERQELVSI